MLAPGFQGCSMARSKSRRGDLRIEVDGVFDVPAAKRLAAVLERARAGEGIRVDLARVSTFEDFGLAMLAQALRETRAGRVALGGLRAHQIRILRYFGVDPDRLRVRVPTLELDLLAPLASADVG